MSALSAAIAIIWGVFWLYWLISSFGVKKGSHANRGRRALFILLGAFALGRILRVAGLADENPALQALGVIVFLSGLGLAVWARVYLGRNWGMPMTEKDEPELVTTGPYQLVRHPIYSGILLGVLGTSLATNIAGLAILGVLAAYFVYSAKVEEKILCASFPATYPAYRTKTKMLIPFVL